jgi:hypothetical protein
MGIISTNRAGHETHPAAKPNWVRFLLQGIDTGISEEYAMRRQDREVTEITELLEMIDSCKVCRIGMQDEQGMGDRGSSSLHALVDRYHLARICFQYEPRFPVVRSGNTVSASSGRIIGPV